MAADPSTSRPRRLTRVEAKARTRELLLEAAAETFARKGFAGASVEEIAQNAGFSTGALYSNFGGKEQLFLELLGRGTSGMVADAAGLLEGQGAGGGGLGKLVIDAADMKIEAESLQAEFWLYAVRNPEAMEMLAARRQETRERLARHIETVLSRRGAKVDEPATAIATVVFALFQGLVRQRRVDPASVPEELFEQALDWLFTGLTEKASSQP
jgi:AcrR family transcriptional regulator